MLRLRSVLTLLLLCCFALSTLTAHARPINARSAILMDATTGRILYRQNADSKIAPASLTKVLAMYVALNAVSAGKASYLQKVKVSRNAANTGGSTMNLRYGERVTLDKLFYGMAVASGNDATVAVAEHIAGSSSNFVGRMNALAKKIGMSRSCFVNPHGLPNAGQVTTATDMMRLARAYLRAHPSAKKYHLEPSIVHNRKSLPNHNPLRNSYSGMTGLKTGWVSGAYNYIATATRNKHTMIAVILGAPNTGIRAAEARRLLDAGFATYSQKSGATAAYLGVSPKQEARYAKMAYSPVDKKKKSMRKKSKTTRILLKSVPEKKAKTPPKAK